MNVVLSTIVDCFVCQFSSTIAIVVFLGLRSFIRYNNSSSYLVDLVKLRTTRIKSATAGQVAVVFLLVTQQHVLSRMNLQSHVTR